MTTERPCKSYVGKCIESKESSHPQNLRDEDPKTLAPKEEVIKY